MGIDCDSWDSSDLHALDPTAMHFRLPTVFWIEVARSAKKGDDRLLVSLEQYTGPEIPSEWVKVMEASSEHDVESALFLLELTMNDDHDYCADVPRLIEHLDAHAEDSTMASAALGLMYRDQKILDLIGLDRSSAEAQRNTLKYFQKIRYERFYGDRERVIVMDLSIDGFEVWGYDSPVERLFGVELDGYLPAWETAYRVRLLDEEADWKSIRICLNNHFFDDFGNFYENYEEYIGVDCISNFLAYLIKDKTDCVYSILDLNSWNYGEEEWGGMPRLRPEYRGVKEKLGFGALQNG